ncbi:MAG TPA: hypothetical protein VF018_06880 [Acidobacteriaceae bacterium]
MIARIALEASGALRALFGLREVFRDIFHPTLSGSLSDFVGRFMSFLMWFFKAGESVPSFSRAKIQEELPSNS